MNREAFREFVPQTRFGRDASAAFFAPRRVYGQYLGSVLDREMCRARSVLRHVRTEANEVRLCKAAVEITLTDGSLHAERVVPALGNPASSPSLASCDSGVPERHWPSPWLDDALRVRQPDERILLVGTGLSAVDAVLAIQAQNAGCQVYMVSRRGILPHVHNLSLTPAPAPEFRDPRHLRSMFRELRNLIGTMRKADRCWRIAIDSLRPVSNHLWQALPVRDRRQFSRQKPFWEAHRQMPASDRRDSAKPGRASFTGESRSR